MTDRDEIIMIYPTEQFYLEVGGELIPVDPDSEKGRELSAHATGMLMRSMMSVKEVQKRFPELKVKSDA